MLTLFEALWHFFLSQMVYTYTICTEAPNNVNCVNGRRDRFLFYYWRFPGCPVLVQYTPICTEHFIDVLVIGYELNQCVYILAIFSIVCKTFFFIHCMHNIFMIFKSLETFFTVSHLKQGNIILEPLSLQSHICSDLCFLCEIT